MLSEADKWLKANVESGIIKLSGIRITRDVGLKGRNFWMLHCKSGKEYMLLPDAQIEHVQAFAGKGKGELRTEEADRSADIHGVQCKGTGGLSSL